MAHVMLARSGKTFQRGSPHLRWPVLESSNGRCWIDEKSLAAVKGGTIARFARGVSRQASALYAGQPVSAVVVAVVMLAAVSFVLAGGRASDPPKPPQLSLLSAVINVGLGTFACPSKRASEPATFPSSYQQAEHSVSAPTLPSHHHHNHPLPTLKPIPFHTLPNPTTCTMNPPNPPAQTPIHSEFVPPPERACPQSPTSSSPHTPAHLCADSSSMRIFFPKLPPQS
ncbi:hypothetical protein Q7P37_004178 [Cladosporium fusiforme]